MKKVLIFIVALIAGILIFSFAIGKHNPVKDGQAGVVVGPDGKYKIYQAGEKPFVIPLVQKLYAVSLQKQDFIISGKDGYMLSDDGRNILIESRVIYKISDLDRAINTFGPVETHQKVRERIRQLLIPLLQEKIKDISYLDSAQKRIPAIAEIHLGLNDSFSKQGISILSYQLRY